MDGVPMNFPPPPRTVKLTAPDGKRYRVNAYTAEDKQRVRWNPTIAPRGDWEVDPDVAKWSHRPTNPQPWTLTTIVTMRPSQALTPRVVMLEAHSENLIQRVYELEKDNDVLQQQVEWLANEFALDMPTFEPRTA